MPQGLKISGRHYVLNEWGISEPVPRQKDWITGEDKLSNQYGEQ